MRVYLDACVIIYLVEAQPPFHEKILSALDGMCREDDSALLTSRLSLLECRVRAMRNKDTPLLQRYADFFHPDQVYIHEIDAATIERATELRAQYAYRAPDAIHLATAIEANADVFLTGDLRLAQCREIVVRVL
jgi:predicted nucleic acid-binding protein